MSPTCHSNSLLNFYTMTVINSTFQDTLWDMNFGQDRQTDRHSLPCAPGRRNMHHQGAICTMVHKGDYVFCNIKGTLRIFCFGGSLKTVCLSVFTQDTLCTTTMVYGGLVHHQGAICTTKAQYAPWCTRPPYTIVVVHNVAWVNTDGQTQNYQFFILLQPTQIRNFGVGGGYCYLGN